MLKNLFCILAAVLILLNSAGSYFVFLQMKQDHKAKVFSTLLSTPPKNLEVFDLDLNPGIQFIDDGKEFLLNGEMYDVVKAFSLDGRKIVYAVKDTREKHLLSALQLFHPVKATDNKSKSESPKKVFTDKFTFSESRLIPEHFGVALRPALINTPSTFVFTGSIPVPPPELA